MLVNLLAAFGHPFPVYRISIPTDGIFRRRNHKTVITNVAQVSNPLQGMQAAIPLDHENIADRRLPRNDASFASRPDARREPALIDVSPTIERGRRGYDEAKWHALVEYDEDIAKVANALAPYPRKYTDEFAAAYLALNDKTYLPVIIKKILATARADGASGSRHKDSKQVS